MTRMQGDIGDSGCGWLPKGKILCPLLTSLVSSQSLPPTHGSGMNQLTFLGRGRGHSYKEVCGGSSGCGFILCLCKEQCKLWVGDDGCNHVGVRM